MTCDMCGNKEAVYNAEVEGSLMQLCNSCASHGEIKSKIRREEQVKPEKKEKLPSKPSVEPVEEIVEIITSDYASKIKKAREKQLLKQEDVARKLNEKESVIQNVESGKMQPSIPLARKLERYFKITLVEEYKEKKPVVKQKEAKGSLTLGDIAMVRKRKK